MVAILNFVFDQPEEVWAPDLSFRHRTLSPEDWMYLFRWEIEYEQSENKNFEPKYVSKKWVLVVNVRE